MTDCIMPETIVREYGSIRFQTLTITIPPGKFYQFGTNPKRTQLLIENTGSVPVQYGPQQGQAGADGTAFPLAAGQAVTKYTTADIWVFNPSTVTDAQISLDEETD